MRQTHSLSRRASKNYIVTLEERIKSLEGVIESNRQSGSPNWNERNKKASNPNTEIYDSATQDIISENQFEENQTNRPATYLPPHQQWVQTSPVDAEQIIATPINVRHISISSNPREALSVVSPTARTYDKTSSTYCQMNLPSVTQPSSPFSLPIPAWTDLRDSSVISNNRPVQENASNKFGTNGPRCVDEGCNHASYPSPLSASAEPPNGTHSTSPSYEQDRQVKEKVRLRCFGPTCPLHVLLRPNSSDVSPNPSSSESQSPSFDSEEFRKELLNIYWDFQPLSVRVVHKEMFMEHFFLGKPSEYYSDFLLNCILACAVRLSSRPTIRRLSTLYIKRAKADLVNALEQASIGAVQGFCLLADFEMSSGRDQAGWVYAGMRRLQVEFSVLMLTVAGIACSLLFDLGLHQDCSDLVKTGHLSDIEATIRRQAFFSCLVNERLWCMYLGRPSLIKMSDFSTRRPKIMDPSFDVQTQAAWVDLSLLSSEISDIFNCPSLVDEQTIRRLSEVDTRLHSWYDSLPAVLKSSDGHGTELHPHTFALHMQFCGIQILIYRTSIMTTRKFSPAAFSEEEICELRGQTIQQSRSTYYYNAVKIARLLAAFKEKVGLERVPTVMLDNIYIATIGLISYVSRSTNAGEGFEADIKWMILLLDALEALQTHYPVAVRMRLTLSDVLRRSWLANSFNSPLYHKVETRGSGSLSTDSGGQSRLNQQVDRPHTGKRLPIFDAADLWVIPEDFGDIGYPQLYNSADYQMEHGIEINGRDQTDMGIYSVSGMDLLEM
jgi:Fungal specific transcription factor domain